MPWGRGGTVGGEGEGQLEGKGGGGEGQLEGRGGGGAKEEKGGKRGGEWMINFHDSYIFCTLAVLVLCSL